MIVIVLGAIVAATLVSAAFGADETPSPGVVITWIRDAGSDDPVKPTATLAAPTEATPTGQPRETSEVTPVAPKIAGFHYPIAGACLPGTDNLMPGAPRAYRSGIHEGVDFYDGASCAAVPYQAEVLAATAGIVVRADWDYVELTADDLARLIEAAVQSGGKDPDALDGFRGRQVWIDHGGGLVTRYAHLDSIADGIAEGTVVGRGDLVAYVGDSGTPESVTNPGAEAHLHFEIRTGSDYLGAGQDPAAVRELYERAFSSEGIGDAGY